jgi:hypothetical protein
MTTTLDFRNPDYIQVFQERLDRIAKIRANPSMLPFLKTHYKNHPVDFINDWGCTTDPRNVDIDLPVVIPFILFPRQVEWIEWVMESWRARRPGVTAKSRESGVSWMAIALSCTLCLFNDYMVIGFGSRKAEFVDKLGAPKSLFWKAREFMALLPKEFRGTWTRAGCPEMRIKFPDTGSVMQGEAGDDIGRGDRASLYFVDEAAHLEHPELADRALSSTTNCRMDVSTAHGLGNPFHRKVTEWPAERVFRFHWTHDPRKDMAWYEKQVEESDPVTIAQEIDIDFSASVEGRLIPSAWVMAAVDAHLVLGITPTGARAGALDVADEGKDKNAFCGSHGVLIDHMEEWSGKGDDIFGTVQRTFGICTVEGYPEFRYDADGLGAGVRGDARIINEVRVPKITVIPFRGSGPVHDPEGEMVKGRKNKDFFSNAKAQSWWSLRERFQRTYRWVKEGVKCNPDSIISISGKLTNVGKLIVELSQPTYTVNQVGKIVIDKAPEGTKSPNLADAVMIRFCVGHRPMRISTEALERMGIRV